jgi:uncharacterized protein (TIGR02145 family)
MKRLVAFTFKSALGLVCLFACVVASEAWAQSTAVTQEQNGSKVYLKIDPQFLQSDLDSLFYKVNLLNASISNISWASALNNGATPGRNVDFFGFDALGLEDLTAAGTLSADSLVLLKDASIAGGLTVNQNVTINQNLYVDSVRNNPSTDLTLFSSEDFKLDVSADIILDAGDDLYIYTNDRFIVDADDSVFVGVDATGDADFLVMTETGGTNPFLWLQDPSIVHSDNFTHLFNEDGMRLSVGVDDDDVGIEMHDRSDIMIVYADSMYVPVNRTYFQQIDPDEANEFHPIFGGQEHVFMTDNFAVAHTAIMQHLPAVTDGTSNLLSLYGVDHVSIAVGGAVNAGIEMTETVADGHMVLYADSMALKGEVVVPNQLWVEQLEVNQVIDGQVNSLANHNTDDVVETATNRYYSPAREQVLLDSIADLRDDLDSMMVVIAAIQAALSVPAFTCGTSTVSYDVHNYTTVQIGSQCWFAENLQNDNYRDGTVIPGGLNASQWMATTTGAYAVHDQGGSNELANLAIYGRLYNWYAVNNAAGLCPTGWHVPTDADWTALETQLGGPSVAGVKMRTSSWGGDNSSGFSGLPGGYRQSSDGGLGLYGDRGYWWSASSSGSEAWGRDLWDGSTNVSRNDWPVQDGFSVRCVQD